jgi:hypothetical protein
MISNFSKNYMDDLYDTNFQSNGEFCKICIRYSSKFCKKIYDLELEETLKSHQLCKACCILCILND